MCLYRPMRTGRVMTIMWMRKLQSSRARIWLKMTISLKFLNEITTQEYSVDEAFALRALAHLIGDGPIQHNASCVWKKSCSMFAQEIHAQQVVTR